MEIDASGSEKSLSFCCLKIDNKYCVSSLTREGSAGSLLLREKLNRKDITMEQAQDYENKLGINKGFTKLYAEWMKGVLRGDFEKSLSKGKEVSVYFWSKYKITLTLAFLSVFFEILTAFPIGLIAGTKRNKVASKVVSLWSVLTCSIPSFWLAFILVWLLSMKLHWKYAIGYIGTASLIVPALTMAFISSGNLARIIRQKSREVLREQFVEFAYSQGMKERDILYFHVLPYVLPPAISIIILDFSGFVGGAVIIENIFNIPGFGGLLQDAIKLKDYPLISCSLFFIGTMIITLNLLADIIYPKLDKRSNSELYKVEKRG